MDVTWEYKIVYIEGASGGFLRTKDVVHDKVHAQLNQLGTEGWELVSCMPNSVVDRMYCVFKRAIRRLPVDTKDSR